MGERPIQPPGFEELVTELLLIRRKGITELRFLELPAWRQACRSARLSDEDQGIEAPQIEALLRRGVEALGGGRIGECAGLLFGLEPGTRGDSPTQLRKDASERWGISEARFRRDPQTKICHQIVDAVLLYIDEQHTRQAHLNLERRLAPTSRLAVAWLERFESYYRIWSSATGIASDLCAYRST